MGFKLLAPPEEPLIRLGPGKADCRLSQYSDSSREKSLSRNCTVLDIVYTHCQPASARLSQTITHVRFS